MLKYCADILTNPIRYLFSLTLTKSYLPIEWRTHCIIPVFKTGDHTVISNYRPISLLCIISKVIEKIIFKETTQFVSNSFTPHQFGFLPGRSTLQQLLLFINELLDAKENNKMSDVIYLDFKKAFDSVSHCKLLLKLRSCGIAGKLFNWFKAYLTNRHQYVRINDSCSESLPVLSGVPQGSILGPLFFVLFINDLPNCLKSSLPFIFADDTKCLKHTINPDISEVDLLQQDLNNAFHWSINNDLSFNFAKFVHIQFWSRTTLDTSNTTFTMDSKPITTAEYVKDLGVLVAQDLSWDSHYKLISGKAYKMLGLIRRSFSVSCPISARRKLYISLVRSQLLYCSQIWRPSLIKHINILERIQRRTTKFILNDFHSTYKSRLVTLKMLPLMYIYEINDILFFIKLYKSPTSHFNINNYLQFSSSNTRFGSSAKLVHHRCSTNLTHHFYFHRIPRLWNSLPTVDLTAQITSIKHKLYIYMWNHFIQEFNDNDVHTFHYLCPCSQCVRTTKPPLYDKLP